MLDWIFMLKLWNIRSEEPLGKTNVDILIKRRLKFQVEFNQILEMNPDMSERNAELLRGVQEADYNKMNLHQMGTLLYSAKILAKVNKRKRKALMAMNHKIGLKKNEKKWN